MSKNFELNAKNKSIKAPLKKKDESKKLKCLKVFIKRVLEFMFIILIPFVTFSSSLVFAIITIQLGIEVRDDADDILNVCKEQTIGEKMVSMATLDFVIMGLSVFEFITFAIGNMFCLMDTCQKKEKTPSHGKKKNVYFDTGCLLSVCGAILFMLIIGAITWGIFIHIDITELMSSSYSCKDAGVFYSKIKQNMDIRTIYLNVCAGLLVGLICVLCCMMYFFYQFPIGFRD